jgi:hypothetical protein
MGGFKAIKNVLKLELQKPKHNHEILPYYLCLT